MSILPKAAWLLTASGSLALYLTSRHQRLLPQPLPARPARITGTLLLLAALGLLLCSLQAPAALYVYVTALMLFLVAWPFLGALVRLGRDSGDDR